MSENLITKLITYLPSKVLTSLFGPDLQEMEADGRLERLTKIRPRGVQELRKAIYKWRNDHDHKNDHNDLVHVQRLIDTEYTLRLIVQQETFFLEERGTLQKEMTGLLTARVFTPVSTEMIGELHQQLEVNAEDLYVLNQRYCTFHAYWCQQESKLSDGILRRALRGRWADMNWYFDGYLRRKCVEQGGCCGRACRCCEKLRSFHRMKGALGHCTPTCGCCRVYHHDTDPSNYFVGETLEPAEVNLLDEKKVDGVKERMIKAYLWG